MFDGLRDRRWRFVASAALAVGLAGTYQFAWPVLRGPIGAQSGASGPALGTVFTGMIVAQTLAAFPAGWIRDRYGPRLPMLVATLFVVIGYAGTAIAPTTPELYLWFAVGGAGVGIAYDVAINTPSRWFRTRRGLATGAVSMAFSLTSFALIPFVHRAVDAAFATTMLALAAAAGAASLVAAFVIRDPRPASAAPSSGAASDGGEATADAATAMSWRSMIETRGFWLLYTVFVVVNGVGLMVIEKVVTYAGELGLSTAEATAAASIVALGQGSGVLAGGAASDKLGAERTVAASLFLTGFAIVGVVAAGRMGFEWAFVALAGVTMFFRSPAFGILPGVVSERFGRTYSGENYGVMLTAKLWGGVFGGTATSLLVLRIGWSATFLVGAALAIAVGAVALVVFVRSS
ncbi:MFS transporter [Halosolutus gelatinilyticus]|uniref:MFS transporter n=1 Tax=Halosolutus gelatinilyticus TaxID=2931975 RepID=UPI001FF6176D|nr:MFS transporter [Halosolutus gelatinilyticus]